MVNALGTSQTTPARGRYIYNIIEEPIVWPGQEKTDTIENFTIKAGEYKFIAFNGSSTEIDYEQVEEYLTHDDFKLQDLNIRFQTYPKGNEALKTVMPFWVDYNNYANYMQPSVQSIYYDTLAVRTIANRQHHHLHFDNPKRLTQRLEILFDIQKVIDSEQARFTVDSVFAEVAGVPYVVNMATGHLDIRSTAKTIFKANFDKDTETNETIHCTSNIDVPTVLPSNSENELRGPGIMQVMIFCSTKNPFDPEGERFSKRFQGIINLYHTLTDADLVQYSIDRQNVVKIKADLKVNGESVIKSSDGNEGLDMWIPSETLHIDM